MYGLKRITLLILTGVVLSTSVNGFSGVKATDAYPLHRILGYKFVNKEQKSYKNKAHLMSDIIRHLDIENNPRYVKTGVIYRNGKAYEIPSREVEDFNLEVSHYNTYCNVFVIDVLNILANTLNDDSFRIVKSPVLANDLRNIFGNSKNWKEVPKSEAHKYVKAGKIVVLSYTEHPHGHVAFVKPNSNEKDIYLWNVGAVNSNNLKWNKSYNTKYFVKID